MVNDFDKIKDKLVKAVEKKFGNSNLNLNITLDAADDAANLIIESNVSGRELTISLVEAQKKSYLYGFKEIGSALGYEDGEIGKDGVFRFDYMPPEAFERAKKAGARISQKTINSMMVGDSGRFAVENVQSIIKQGILEGQAGSVIGNSISEFFDKSKFWKAAEITRTEVPNAYNMGRIDAARTDGITKAKIMLGGRPCNWCLSNYESVTTIEEAEAYMNAHHPNNDCTVVPLVDFDYYDIEPPPGYEGDIEGPISEPMPTPGVSGTPPKKPVEFYPHTSQIVSSDVPAFAPVSEAELVGKTSGELKKMAGERGIKYFRVMNKEELAEVLRHPGKVKEIAEIAKARWQKKVPRPPNPAGEIVKAAEKYEEMTSSKLMGLAKERGVKNFRIMSKDQLVQVLSDPSKNEAIQKSLKEKLATAKKVKGIKPGTTKADDLGLVDVVGEKDDLINQVVDLSTSHSKTLSSEEFRKTLKAYLEKENITLLQEAVNKKLRIDLFDKWQDVYWTKAQGFDGVYSVSKKRLAIIKNFSIRQESVFFHEFGHFIDDVGNRFGGNWNIPKRMKGMFREVDKLYNAKFKEASAIVKKRKGIEPMVWRDFAGDRKLPIISPYSMDSPSEYFAESLSYYMSAPHILLKKDSAMYKLIKKIIFEGVEFLK